MNSITVLGCTILVVFSYINSPGDTVKLVTTIITVRGATWLTEKVTAAMNKDAAEFINFAGWSIAGISVVGLINHAIHGLPEIFKRVQVIVDGANKVINFIDGIQKNFDPLNNFLDKILPFR